MVESFASSISAFNNLSTITIDVGDTFTDPGATVTDNFDGSTTIYSSDSVDTATVQVYTLTYNAVDSSGNAATAVTRTVIVQLAAALTGVFEDSRVISLSYETPTLSGETNSQGEFEYMAGETITFSVGDIVLGSTPGAEKITTFDVGDTLEKDPVTGEYIDVNRAILLQSLDKNQNPADGFIDLTGVVANLNSGVDIEDGVTQAELEVITGETASAPLVSPSEAVAHADISKNDAIVEENGVLKLNTILTQEDIDAGNYLVQSRVGHEFIAVEPTSSTPILSTESDLTVLSQQGLDQGRLRNSIVIDNSTDTYYLGLGIRYTSDGYGINYYVERYGKGPFSSEYENYQSEKLPAFYEVVIEENKTYNFKLEYDVSLDKVFAYIDGIKVITWNFNSDPRSEGDTVNVRVFSETRAQSAIDPTTGAGTTVGASIIATVDNLIAHFDGQEILNDNFNDNNFDNPNINYSARLLRAGNVAPPPASFESIGTQPSALISPNGGEIWEWGTTKLVLWNNNLITGSAVDFYVLHDDPSNLDQFSSSSSVILSNKIWYKFADSITNSGSFDVNPADLNGTGDAYVVLIISQDDNTKWDISNNTFTLQQ